MGTTDDAKRERFDKMRDVLQWVEVDIGDEQLRAAMESDNAVAELEGARGSVVAYADRKTGEVHALLDLRLEGGPVPLFILGDNGEPLPIAGYSRARVQGFPVAQGDRVLIEYSEPRRRQWVSEQLERLRAQRPDAYEQHLAELGSEQALRDALAAEHEEYGCADVVHATHGMAELINERNGRYVGRDAERKLNTVVEATAHDRIGVAVLKLSPESRAALQALLAAAKEHAEHDHVCNEGCEDAGEALSETVDAVIERMKVGPLAGLHVERVDKSGWLIDTARWHAYRRDDAYRRCHRATVRSSKYPGYAELVCDWVGLVTYLGGERRAFTFVHKIRAAMDDGTTGQWTSLAWSADELQAQRAHAYAAQALQQKGGDIIDQHIEGMMRRRPS